MSFVEIILLALALCVDSFTVSLACSFRSRMSLRRGLLMAFVFAVFQGGFPFAGAMLGSAFRAAIDAVDHWVAFALLLAVGGKMIVDGLRDSGDSRQLDVSNVGVMCLLGVATSIDAFVVGIGLGLENDFVQIVASAVVICLVTFAVSLLGVALGRRRVSVSERYAAIAAGLVLIGLGVFALVEHFAQ